MPPRPTATHRNAEAAPQRAAFLSGGERGRFGLNRHRLCLEMLAQSRPAGDQQAALPDDGKGTNFRLMVNLAFGETGERGNRFSADQDVELFCQIYRLENISGGL